MHIRARNSWVKHLDFIFADLICINITFLFAYFLRFGIHNMYAMENYRNIIIVAMILHFCVSFFSNCYSGILNRGYFQEFKKVFFHNVKLVGILFAYMFATQSGSTYSRIMLVSFFLMDTLAMYALHICLKYVLKKRGVSEAVQQKALVVSKPELVEEAIRKITDGPDKGHKIIGIAFESEETDIRQVQGIPVVACGREMYSFVCGNAVDEVLICVEPSENEKIERLTTMFLEMGITVHVLMDAFIRNVDNVYFGHINQANIMTASTKTVSTTEMFFKRLMDICAGIIGCFITAILFIFIAPAIKIADPKGPVFFAQERAGRNGRIFKIYKFRSMYSDAEERKQKLMAQNKMDGLMFKIDDDPRIIGSGPDGKKKGLGHFLRTTSLDEFPNFWSILKGDMSLVGTRPPTLDEYEKYELHHKSRLAAKPGLTGLWQVSGRSDMTDFEEIVKLDNEYIKNWSIGLDIKIVLKTIWVVLTRKGSV